MELFERQIYMIFIQPVTRMKPRMLLQIQQTFCFFIHGKTQK